MSYRTMAAMAKDYVLTERVAACAATQGAADPISWAAAHSWVLAAQPGWDSAYAYAVELGNENPGADHAVISDEMILAAVQEIRSTTSPTNIGA